MDANHRHTILLVQSTQSLTSRTYYDFETISDAVDGVIRLFEQQLAKERPNVLHISYDISQLLSFVDNHQDMACLIFEPQVAAYSPRNKQWIKQQITNTLQRQASR